MEKVEHGIWISLSLGVPTHEQSHSQDLMIEPLKEFFNYGPFNLDHVPHLARLSRLLDIQLDKESNMQPMCLMKKRTWSYKLIRLIMH